MRFLTTDEVATQLGVSKRSVERWAKDGLIPCVRIKATVRIPETVISSGSLIADGIIEQNTSDRVMLLRQVQTAGYFLDHAAEMFEERVLAYVDAAIALDLVAPDAADDVMGKLRTFRKSSREVWGAIGEAQPTDIRLRDCGEGSRFASGSVA